MVHPWPQVCVLSYLAGMDLISWIGGEPISTCLFATSLRRHLLVLRLLCSAFCVFLLELAMARSSIFIPPLSFIRQVFFRCFCFSGAPVQAELLSPTF